MPRADEAEDLPAPRVALPRKRVQGTGSDEDTLEVQHGN
jgi:hypothetical protein